MRRRARTLEAAAWLVIAHALVARVAFHRWSRLLGSAGPTEPFTGMPAERRGPLPMAVLGASRRLPYEPTCLEQATAAQIMLRLRRRRGSVVIGLDRSDPTNDPHAWLLDENGQIVLGGESAASFKPVTTFTPHR